MSKHHRLLSGFLIALAAGIASECHAAGDESFRLRPLGTTPRRVAESIETARMVATGTLAEYRLGGYLVSSTGSKANISVKMNWETVHFGLKPPAAMFRQIPVKSGTRPKLQYSKGDKVIISWQTSSRFNRDD